MTWRFTGWHMTAILIAFFGVVIAVNVYMARAAIATFGGTVVDNSYVASQEFNSWLAAARKQEAEGWTLSLSLDADRVVMVDAKRRGDAPAALAASGTAIHPLGRVAPIALTFASGMDGRLVSRQALPAGRWLVRVAVRDGREQARAEAALQ